MGLKKLKTKYAKGGAVEHALRAKKFSKDARLNSILTELGRSVDNQDWSSATRHQDSLRKEFGWSEEQIEGALDGDIPTMSRPVKKAKGGMLHGLEQLRAKYTGDTPPPSGGKPRGPIFVDSYGTEYNSPEELLAGVRQAVEEESDEPRWADAAAMLKKLPGSEQAQQVLDAFAKAYQDPEADLTAVGQAWQQALDALTGGGKPQFAKGGSVRSLSQMIREKGPDEFRRARDELIQRDKRTGKPLTKEEIEEEKGRKMKLSTFAKGGLARLKKKAMSPSKGR